MYTLESHIPDTGTEGTEAEVGRWWGPWEWARAPWSLGASLICDHHWVCLAPDSGLWMLSCGHTAWHSSCS